MAKQQSLASFFSMGAKRSKENEGVVKRQKVETGVKQEVLKVKEEVNELLKVDPLFAKSTEAEAKKETKTEEETSKEAGGIKPIMYERLCSVFDEIEKESSRLKIIDIISKFFVSILEEDPRLLVKIIYLSINKLGPDYDNTELGLGETLLIKAISESTGRSTGHIKNEYKEVGDLGSIAQTSRAKQRQMFKAKPLDIITVFKNLQTIANSTGTNSQQRKINIIVKMLTSCSGVEAKFLIRSLEGKLRIGLADKSILVALAKAFIVFENQSAGKKPIKVENLLDEAEVQIKVAFNQVPNYEMIVDAALKYGILNLQDNVKLTPGIPLKPMLAKPTKSIGEILDKFSEKSKFTCEYKYDGERAQIHLLKNGEIKVFSRNSENMTERYPDLIDSLHGFIEPEKVKSLILDAEVVAWDREKEKILPFQVLTTRKRKDVKLEDIKVQICIFVFDMICLNDEPLIQKTFEERREAMHKNLVLKPGQLQFANHKNVHSVEEIQEYLDQSIKDSCEGLMVKSLESTYEPSERSSNWLKLKKDYLQGVGDSIDLVVIGAYFGRGKRTGWYGGFLLACYNADNGEYETTCKIGTGFSEDDLKSLHEKLKPLEESEPKSYYVYNKDSSTNLPDVWFEPQLVFEVQTADLSLSPVYKAGSGKYDKGISLRFPRFLRLRDDKSAENATNSDQIIEMYESQANLQ